MKRIDLSKLIFEGNFDFGIKLGLNKEELSAVTGVELYLSNETPDCSSYYAELPNGVVLYLLLDIDGICFDIKLKFEDNPNIEFYCRRDNDLIELKGDTPFEELIDFFDKFHVIWNFDNKRTYYQIICILLNNGLRLYYSFGSKKDDDYGLFDITLLLGNHPLIQL